MAEHRLRDIRITHTIEGQVVAEHYVPAASRTTIGRDARGNLLTWPRLPKCITLVAPRGGSPTLILHDALSYRALRPGEAPVRLDPEYIQEHTLCADEAVEVELGGAMLLVESVDLAMVPEVTPPTSVWDKSIDRGSVKWGGLATSLSAAALGIFLGTLPAAPSSTTPSSPSVADAQQSPTEAESLPYTAEGEDALPAASTGQMRMRLEESSRPEHITDEVARVSQVLATHQNRVMRCLHEATRGADATQRFHLSFRLDGEATSARDVRVDASHADIDAAQARCVEGAVSGVDFNVLPARPATYGFDVIVESID